jgi:hypothetical protein
MNAFIEHHQQAIRFDYSCFDRILLNGVIQILQNPACVVGFLKEKRQADRVTPAYFKAISTDYHHFVQAFAEKRHVEVLMPPKGVRREELRDARRQIAEGQLAERRQAEQVGHTGPGRVHRRLHLGRRSAGLVGQVDATPFRAPSTRPGDATATTRVRD